MDRVYLGIDCGATHLRVGLVNNQGAVLAFHKTRSPLKNNPDSLAQRVQEIVNELSRAGHFSPESIRGIGAGVPGPLDLEKGLILKSANLNNNQPIDIKEQFESVFNRKIYLDRDTNAALLGEAWVGAAQGFQDVVMLTIGTGVGGAVMINGEIERGRGQAGELGHMLITAEGTVVPLCGLNHQGCLEAWIGSAKSIEEMGIYLGYGLANIVNILNPEKIIIGGGKVRMGNFLPQALEIMKEKGMKPAVEEIRVEYAKLGDQGGVIGAVKLAIDGEYITFGSAKI